MMHRESQSGITLIELLLAIVLLSVIIVPLLSFLTFSYGQTVSQGREGQLHFFAQEVMEQTKADLAAGEISSLPYVQVGQCSTQLGCVSGGSSTELPNYTVQVNPAMYDDVSFADIEVEIVSVVDDKTVELFTVLRQ